MTAREREVARLSRRIARELVSDLVTGRPRAASGQALVSVLRRARTMSAAPRPRSVSSAEAARQANRTFVSIPLNRQEFEYLRAKAEAVGLSMTKYARLAIGLPAEQHS